MDIEEKHIEQLNDLFEKIKNDSNNIDINNNILIIDDDKWIHRVLSHYLKELNFPSLNAYDAYDGIAMTIKEKPLIIILDIIMPEIKGDSLLKMFKRIEDTANIPVIIMSSNLNKSLLKETFKLGVSGYLSKPITRENLFFKLRDSLNNVLYKEETQDEIIESL